MKASFLRHVAQTSLAPDGFEVTHGQGIYLFDAKGHPFMDCISGISVSSLGHSHPAILDAIRKQLDFHLHTQVYGEHITAPQIHLAKKLASVLPPSLQTIYFTNSGAEAVEGALKLAKKYTGRFEIIACRDAYHGSTAGAESLRSDLEYTSASRPLVPGIRHIQFNQLTDLDAIDHRTAAVIIEPIQAEAGIILPDAGYLAALKNKCQEQGALLIVDEIQTGMGRTGSLWNFEQAGIVPDVFLLAKAFGGGLPLGAFIADQHIMKVLSENPSLGHLTTFGGNALSCVASLAALNFIIENDLPDHAKKIGKLIKERLSSHAAIREVRGEGLLMAVDLKNPDHMTKAIAACREEGLLVDWFLFNNRSLRLAPPLIISEEEALLLCSKMRNALDTLLVKD